MNNVSREAPDDPKDRVDQSPEGSSCGCKSSGANAMDVAEYLMAFIRDSELSVKQIRDELRWIDQMLSDVYEDPV